MSSKSFYGLFILLFTLTFVSCATLPFEKNSNAKFKQKYEMVSVEENLDYLNTKIEYPQFENIPELNKRIENSIINNWKSFKSYSKDEWKEIVALNTRGTAKLPPFEYIVSCEVTGNKNIISVLINTYVFNGGAHGNTSLSSYNYNSSEKAYIDIKNASGMSYKEISEICRQYLLQRSFKARFCLSRNLFSLTNISSWIFTSSRSCFNLLISKISSSFVLYNVSLSSLNASF